jgi:hypothetical protein
MYTKNNTVLVNNAREMNCDSIPLTELTKRTSVLTLPLPSGLNPNYFAFLRSLDVVQVENEPIVRITLINNQNNRYVIECTDGLSKKEESPSKIYKHTWKHDYKSISEIIESPYTIDRFITLDWKGLPCKIEKVERDLYTGPLFNIITKKTDNILLSGIPVWAKDETAPEDGTTEDESVEETEEENDRTE